MIYNRLKKLQTIVSGISGGSLEMPSFIVDGSNNGEIVYGPTDRNNNFIPIPDISENNLIYPNQRPTGVFYNIDFDNVPFCSVDISNNALTDPTGFTNINVLLSNAYITYYFQRILQNNYLNCNNLNFIAWYVSYDGSGNVQLLYPYANISNVNITKSYLHSLVVLSNTQSNQLNTLNNLYSLSQKFTSCVNNIKCLNHNCDCWTGLSLYANGTNSSNGYVVIASNNCKNMCEPMYNTKYYCLLDDLRNKFLQISMTSLSVGLDVSGGDIVGTLDISGYGDFTRYAWQWCVKSCKKVYGFYVNFGNNDLVLFQNTCGVPYSTSRNSLLALTCSTITSLQKKYLKVLNNLFSIAEKAREKYSYPKQEGELIKIKDYYGHKWLVLINTDESSVNNNEYVFVLISYK
jgi:hypothetical protein